MPNITRPLLTLVALAGAAGCGGASASPGRRPTTPAPAREQPTARPSNVASLTTSWESRVLFQQRDSLVLTLPNGAKQVQSIGRDLQFTLMLRNGTLSVRLDTMVLFPSAPGLASEAIGTVWTAKLGAFGRLEDLSPSKSGILVEEISTAVAALIPRLPRGGATIGQSWSDTTDRSLRVEIFRAQEKRTASWRAQRATEGDGIRVIPIEFRELFEQIGQGTSANRQMKMTAQGSRSGTYYITADGRVDRAGMADTIAKLITIPESRQSIPTMQYSRTLIRYRPLAARPDE